MSDRWPGGIIRSTPVTPTGPLETGTAPGIWTMDQAAYWQKQNLWPTQGVVPRDPYFSYVSLLLGTTSLNGAQNNTFLDSSSNGFTITRSGNATQGSFGPYGANWSYYFDNGTSYLSCPSSNVMTGDFTVEMWAYFTGFGAGAGLYTIGNESSGRVVFYVTSGGVLAWDLYGAGTTTFGGSVPLNTWVYLTFVKSGTIVSAYLNGSLVSTRSMNYTVGNANGFFVGGSMYGYLSNFRVVNGTALYTGNFTPPTSPLTAVSGTLLLTCQSNRFVDKSSNNFTLTRNNTVNVTEFSAFSPSSSYNPATTGGSGYFDGSGDYISAGSNAAFAFGTGDFTVECWFYATTSSTSQSLISTDVTNGFFLAFDGPLTFGIRGIAGLISFSPSSYINAWNHVAVSRSGGTLSMFFNGTRVGTVGNSTNFSPTGPLILGGLPAASAYYWTGYIANARVVKGTAVYNPAATSITIPTSPVTSVSGTSLLCNFANAGIYDSATINDMETAGDAKVTTAVSKFGGSSIAFDGTGDYLSIPNQVTSNFGNGDFTVEMWININSFSGSIGVLGKRASEANYSPIVIEATSNTLRLYLSNNGSSWGVSALSTGSLSTGTWYHYAISRSGSTVYVFVNGVSIGSTGSLSGALMTNTDPMTIGQASVSISGSVPFNGYIDDLRITTGVARYTSNFTPPTAAFPTY